MSTKTVRITQRELVKRVAEKLGFTQREVQETLKAFGEVLVEVVKEQIGREKTDKKVSIITPVGTFRGVWTNERKGRNPTTGEPITIPPKLVITFRKNIT